MNELQYNGVKSVTSALLITQLQDKYKMAQKHHFSELSVIVHSLWQRLFLHRQAELKTILAIVGRESECDYMIRDNQNHAEPWPGETAA